ncbi:MAG: outer membrane beta-barrel protein [Nostocaceae cyanobacterium]|nr:outer membrane beta-barrel protein [Nostocaceae cyanobacterium]
MLCSLTTLVVGEFQHQAVAKPTPKSQVGVKNISVLTTIANIATPEKIIDTNWQSKSNFFISQTLPEANEPIPDFPVVEEPPPLSSEDIQEELGEIQIIQPPVKQPPPRRQPNGQLLLRSSIFTSSNTTSQEISQPDDVVFVNSATLLTTPQLGKQTRLIAAVGGGLVRFADEGDSNYNFLNLNVGVQQRLARGMYGQIGWVQERLYSEDDGDRLLLDDSIRLAVGRQDQLDKRLRLDSYYELRASFATPNAQNRVANTLGTRLRYDITPQLQGALDYRISFKDYTRQDRLDTQHRLGIQAIYNINQDLFVGGSASYLFGSSDDSSIDIDNFSVGINFGLNLPLF